MFFFIGRHRILILFYLAVGLGITCFASPLFRVLGFEYSAFSALAVSIGTMFAMLGYEKSVKQILRAHLVLHLLSLIPLLVSFASVFFIPNCALEDGIVFYLQIVPLTTETAILLGLLIAAVAPSKRAAIVAVIGSWLLWLGVSLTPGYFGPQIFTYGWQYGYFPGFVWDEAMELTHGYWFSRIVVLIAILVSLAFLRSPRRWSSLMIAVCIPVFFAVIITYVFSAVYPQSDIIETAPMVRQELSATIQTPQVSIYYKPQSLTGDEIEYLRYSAHAAIDSIRAFFGLQDTSSPVEIYLYPSVAELGRYVGTRNASISKPWRNELHIAKENLGSLRHELVHVLLREQGKFPFAVSYSTGLTEGAAEAFDSLYDGIRTIDYYAARILQDSLAHNVSAIMGFSGFAANASGKSYVLAGAFSSYLISTYGATKFRAVYHSQDYDAVYGRSLLSLDSQWSNTLVARAGWQSPDDLLRTKYYFDRRSIIADACLRRIGKLMKQARALFASKHYTEADSVYMLVANESGRADAITGRVYSHLRLHDPKGALAILDSSRAVRDTIKMLPFHLLRGDLLFLSGASLKAATMEWARAEQLELSADQLSNAVLRLILFSQGGSYRSATAYLQEYYTQNRSLVLDSIITGFTMDSLSRDQELTNGALWMITLFQRARLAEARGELRLAHYYYRAYVAFPCRNWLPPEVETIPQLSSSSLARVMQIALERKCRYEVLFEQH